MHTRPWRSTLLTPTTTRRSFWAPENTRTEIFDGAKAGVFGRILPQRPFSWAQRHWGAFELAARLSALDLDDREIEGGRELNLTFGANWYLLANVKLMANAVYVHVRSADDAFILQARFQVDF